jgi:hypothetical protein
VAHVHGSGNLFIGNEVAKLEYRTGGGKGADAQRIQKIGNETDSDTNQRWPVPLQSAPAANGYEPDRQIGQSKDPESKEKGVLHSNAFTEVYLGWWRWRLKN